MALSGPGETWRRIDAWPADMRPVAVRVYYIDGAHVDDVATAPSHRVAAVCARGVHPSGRRWLHFAMSADEYTVPGRAPLYGGQLGAVDCAEWMELAARIRAEWGAL